MVAVEDAEDLEAAEAEEEVSIARAEATKIIEVVRDDGCRQLSSKRMKSRLATVMPPFPLQEEDNGSVLLFLFI